MRTCPRVCAYVLSTSRVQILAKPEPVRPRPPSFHTSLPAPIHHRLALPSPPRQPDNLKVVDATAAAALGAPVSVCAPVSAVRPRSDPRSEAKAEPEGLRFRFAQIVPPVLDPPALSSAPLQRAA